MITICPHCQHPLTPDPGGETRCPSCGFKVLPQPGKECPVCHQFSLATCQCCQHCQAPLPDEVKEAPSMAMKQKFQRLDKTRILRLVSVLVFGILCFFGVRNYIQDRTKLAEQSAAQQHAHVFAEQLVELQGTLQRLIFLPIGRTGNRGIIDQKLAHELRQNLQQTAIPQCQRLLQSLREMPPEARKFLRNPQQVETGLSKQLAVLQSLYQSLNIEEDQSTAPSSHQTDSHKNYLDTI